MRTITERELDAAATRAASSLDALVDAIEAREQRMSKGSVKVKSGKPRSGDKARPPVRSGELRRTEPISPSPPSSWRDAAACLRSNLDFLTVSGHAVKLQRERMRVQLAICETCSVKAECLAFALGTKQPLGVWGGLLPRERRKLEGKTK
jgi:WhiB family redox-sensing transcriptional regulator